MKRKLPKYMIGGGSVLLVTVLWLFNSKDVLEQSIPPTEFVDDIASSQTIATPIEQVVNVDGLSDTSLTTSEMTDVNLSVANALSDTFQINSNADFDQQMQTLYIASGNADFANEKTASYQELVSRQPEFIDGNLSQENIVCNDEVCMMSIYFNNQQSLDRFMQSFSASSQHPLRLNALVPFEGRANLIFDINP